jgi:YD repeat-containing protein
MRTPKRVVATGCLLTIVSGLALAVGELPSSYRDGGKTALRATDNHSADEHIDPFTGMLQLHHKDAVLPGNGGFDLVLQRSYNSPTQSYGTTSDTTSFNRTPNVGVGWNLMIGGRVYNGTGPGSACGGGQQMVFETPDGGRQALISKGDGTFGSAARWKAICVTGGMQVWAPNGTRYDMLKLLPQSIPGTLGNAPFLYPTRIEDRNGNYATFNYTAIGTVEVLDNVAVTDGRTIRFSYQLLGSVYVLQSLDTGNGIWTFQYDPTPAVVDPYGFQAAWFLTQVNPPAGGPWKYTYNSCNLLTADRCALTSVRYPEGGTNIYTYSFVNFNDGAGLTPVVATKKASGFYMLGGALGNVDTWTYTYTPGTATVNDKTVVQSPLGATTYEHVGVSNVVPGSIWKVGLLVKRTEQQGTTLGPTLQVETYAWDKQQIAAFPTRRVFGLSDPVTYAPQITQRMVTRNGIVFTTNYSNYDIYANAQQIDETGPGRLRGTARTFYIDTAKWILNLPKDDTISDLGLITRTYDLNANLRSETRFGVATSSTYYADGSVASRADANNKTTTYSSYFRGLPRIEQRPEAVTINRTVDGAGNVLSETDGAGNLYSYTYDGIRRLASKTPPIGAPTTIVWSGSSRRTATRGAYVETMDVDGQANPYILSRGSVETAYLHDALGNKQFESYAGAVTHNADGSLSLSGTRFDVDMMGRTTRATHPDGFRQFDHFGASLDETDELSHKVTYTFEAFGDPDKRMLTKRSPPSGMPMVITRDGLGNIRTVKQDTVTRTYGYNGAYFLTSIDDPETGVTTFGRDNVGNMTSRTVGGRQTIYVYDGLNRLTNITYPDGKTVVVTYFGNGRTASVTTPQATRTYVYDANANLKKETLTAGGQTFTTTYAYNSNDALTTLTYPVTGEVVAYTPDALGRPTTAGSFVTSITYHPSGNYDEMKMGNGYSMVQTETARRWPFSIIAVKTGTSKGFMGKDYTYDPVGNVKAITDQFDFRQTMAMGYDENNQLSRTDGPWGVASLTYDFVGNIKTFTFNSSTVDYSYAANKLTSAGSRNFSYDGYGNVTADGQSSFQYDDAPNLTCVNCPAAGAVTYVYDGNNRRVSRTQSGVTTYYVHIANGDLITEYTPSTNKGMHHIYVNGKRIASKRFTF